ncbi:hypothetical protein PSTG_19184, partial [Puccinia striiformis f. sp. tritici PST-78]
MTMTTFLTNLETELRRQKEVQAQANTTASALATTQNPRSNYHPAPTTQSHGSNNTNSNRGRGRRPFCQNGVHNPETNHSEENCHQAHPEKALAYHQAAIDRVKGGSSSNRSLLSVNSVASDAI